MRTGKAIRLFCTILMTAVLVVLLAVTASAESAQTCLITIRNEAAEANTDEAVNALHVYDPNSEEKDDFFSGTEVPVGTEVKIFAYNLASPVQLTIVHGDETIVETRLDMLRAFEDDDKVQFYTVVLEHDLTVTATLVPDTLPAEEENGFPVTLDNAFSDSGVAVNLSYLDFTNGEPAVVPVTSGTVLPEGTGLFVQVLNDSEKNLRVSALIGGNEIDGADIPAGEAGGLMGADFTGIILTGDLTVSVSEIDDSACSITVDNAVEADGVLVSLSYLTTVDGELAPVPVASGESVASGTGIYVQVINDSTKDIRVSAQIDGQEIEAADIPAGEAGGLMGPEFAGILLTGDLTVCVNEAACAVTLTNPMEADGVLVSLSYLTTVDGELAPVPVADGETVALNTGIYVQVINDSDKDIRVSALIDGQEIEGADIPAGEAGGLMGPEFAGILLTGDLAVTVENAAR